MTRAKAGPLGARLFGYGILYRARLRGGDVSVACDPLSVDPAEEARALAGELRCHLDGGVSGPTGEARQEVGLSVPFGRCGIDGRPLEHVRLYHVARAFVDVLTPRGGTSRPVEEGRTVLVAPGSVVRFRAIPRSGHRVLVAFQTEDRTPLHGHAAPLTASGEPPPDGAVERLRQTTDAFGELWRSGGGSSLEAFFTGMAASIEGDPQVRTARRAALASGSYEAGPDPVLFDRARGLLTPDVLERIAGAEEGLFRFPGMFGAVAPLFPLLG